MSKSLLFGLLLFAVPATAAVIPEYANNSYTEHTLSRSEKKCIEEGYKITYANCTNQTAPADRCPYHDSYYRSCSQEQWCRNNNYTFLDKDCKLPTYPVKMCDNKYPMYRSCQEDIEKACKEAGFVSKETCQLTDKRCPYNADFGKCCDSCPDFSHELDKIPVGYVAEGETCTTCDGIVKTNITEAACEGFISCPFGPISAHTPSCRKGKTTLYATCKTPEMFCKEKGYLYTTCQKSEDFEICPEAENLKKCTVNCNKLAKELFPEAIIIADDATDPEIDADKVSVRSLFGQISTTCISNKRPEVTLNINAASAVVYKNLFDKNISNVNFTLNFETPETLSINGTLENVRIKITGNAPDCALRGEKLTAVGTVSLMNAANICADIDIREAAKFITTGNITGNVKMEKDSSLGIKGNLIGSLQTKSYAEVLIKGILKYVPEQNAPEEDKQIIFGCGSQAKISGGITAAASEITIKQRSSMDTPYIKITSTGAGSLHIQKYTKIQSTYDSTEYPLADNSDMSCDDKYLTKDEQTDLTLEPSNLMEDKWQCQTLTRQQLDCN